MVYDPCAPVPDTNIPTGLAPPRHHAVHHVIGRIKHRVHHVHLHLGPPKPAPNLSGCEKHAAGHGALPASPFPALGPVPKLAAAGGLAGVGAAGLVGIGGLGGLIGGGGGGLISGCTVKPGMKVSSDPSCTHTTTPGGGGTGTTTPPNTTPTNVPEPSSIVVFVFAVGIALLARHFLNRPMSGQAV